MTTAVAIEKCAEYQIEQVLQSIKTLMHLCPPPPIAGKVVLLKPNILRPRKPEAAVCTHPVVVAATVRAFLELGAKKVLVGESPATAGSLAAARNTGMLQAVEDAGGTWAEFEQTIEVPVPEGKVVKSINFAQAFTQADVIVSIAKLKTHQLMGYTGTMKNLFGLMVGLQKAESHFRFSSPADFAAFLTDVVVAAKPAYAIMDAIVGMDGPGGPGNGDPVQLGFLAASDNILALDWTCASIVGYDPRTIGNLNEALQRGIWLKSPEQIQTLGIAPAAVKPARFKIVNTRRGTALLKPHMPQFLHRLAGFYFTKIPTFVDTKCIRCGKCIEICPAKTLSFVPNKKQSSAKYPEQVHLEKKNCIHCYCCHEICPADAIVLRRSW